MQELAGKTNRQILEYMFQHNIIDINRGSIFDTDPDPMPANFPFKKIEGMMLGLAIGDSLGLTTEGMLPWKRKSLFGEIRDYLPNHFAGGRAIGLPSDDTQLSFWTLEQMIADRGFIPDHVAARFCKDQIFGIGATISRFVHNYKSGRMQWFECGRKSAANGALMRIAPMVIPHIKSATSGLWTDTAISAMITHNDSAAISSCLAVTRMLWEVLKSDKTPAADWWIETYTETARQLERDESYSVRGGSFAGFQGPLWKFVQEMVSDAYQRGISTLAGCESWLSGAYILETVPSVLYILMKHGADFEEAVVRAVNDTRDNDSIAAIVGAITGALHGREAIPQKWLTKLSGRTAEKDDGKIYSLLTEAKSIWG